MNAVEIEEAVEQLAAQPFNRAEFPFQFLGDGLFTATVARMSTSGHGSGDERRGNTHEVLSELFRAMATDTRHNGQLDDRHRNAAGIKSWADVLPYVNGGLFSGSEECPKFSRIARSYFLRAGAQLANQSVAAQVESTGGTISVPMTAVQAVRGRDVVFVRTPADFRAVTVALGSHEGATVVVNSGLSGSERIASVNSYMLKAELEKGAEWTWTDDRQARHLLS